MTKLFTYGWNVPGYMPDTEPSEPASWTETRDALLWEVERWDEDEHLSIVALDRTAATLRALAPEHAADVSCGNLVLWIAIAD